ncbi:MAG TPA: acyl-CoA desaturase [Gemmataceae bacterium]|nr:acyl-CoA desaturase [Gemmataceae bacterium]
MRELTSLPVSQAAAETASHEHDTVPLSLGMQVANAIAVIVPFLGLVLGIVFLWGHGFSWVELGLFLGMYIVTGVGITVGYHRLFTHRAFETSRVVQFILAVLGSMAVQGPLMQWVAMHRRHHQHSDQEGDPHSPHLHGGGFFDLVRGAWHAHVGWVFRPDPADLAHYNRDLRQSRTLRAASALFPLWVALGLIIPAVVGGVLTASWMGALFGLIWGGLARIFLVHHITWSVNSVCHIWGRRPYPSGDHSRNNFVFGILALGEGWHNNHHAFPTSARHGLRWWQFDLSYYVIRGMALLGLVWKVKLPSKQALTAENA